MVTSLPTLEVAGLTGSRHCGYGHSRMQKRDLRRVGPEVHDRRVFAGGLLILGALLAVPSRARSAPQDAHRPEADCRFCHATAAAATLRQDPAVARTLLPQDLDARCAACHNPLDASHKTGVTPKNSVPASLPLSAGGQVTCATCHFMHGENNAFGDFVRVDNRRGGLCLTCHELSELQ